MENEKVYYLVNPAGAIHTVTKEHARMRLKQIGFRLATAEEIKKYQELEAEAKRMKKHFMQESGKPICKPHSVDPDDQELPDVPDVKPAKEPIKSEEKKPAKQPAEKSE